jgi:hypothetical protein
VSSVYCLGPMCKGPASTMSRINDVDSAPIRTVRRHDHDAFTDRALLDVPTDLPSASRGSITSAPPVMIYSACTPLTGGAAPWYCRDVIVMRILTASHSVTFP